MIVDNEDPKQLRLRIIQLEKQFYTMWKVLRRYAVYDDRLTSILFEFKREMEK